MLVHFGGEDISALHTSVQFTFSVRAQISVEISPLKWEQDGSKGEGEKKGGTKGDVNQLPVLDLLTHFSE